MKNVQERDARVLLQPGSESRNYPFWLALELVNNKGYIHGEIVALGALIIAWQCGEQPELLAKWPDRCRVWHRPTEMGLSRAELRKGLEFVPGHMEEGNTNLILRYEPVTATQFEDLWKFMETR